MVACKILHLICVAVKDFDIAKKMLFHSLYSQEKDSLSQRVIPSFILNTEGY